MNRRPISFHINENECFICVSHKGWLGYPDIKRNNKHTDLHRLIFSLVNGPIPPGMVIRHKCDNPACINPAHLEMGTHADNVADRVARDRSAKGEKNGRAKLNEDDVRTILTAPEGVLSSSLADIYDVDISTIRLIRNGKRWKHLHRELNTVKV